MRRAGRLRQRQHLILQAVANRHLSDADVMRVGDGLDRRIVQQEPVANGEKPSTSIPALRAAETMASSVKPM